jgi:hypothetical protein
VRVRLRTISGPPRKITAAKPLDLDSFGIMDETRRKAGDIEGGGALANPQGFQDEHRPGHAWQPQNIPARPALIPGPLSVSWQSYRRPGPFTANELLRTVEHLLPRQRGRQVLLD